MVNDDFGKFTHDLVKFNDDLENKMRVDSIRVMVYSTQSRVNLV